MRADCPAILISGVEWANGTVSSVGLTVANAPGAWINQSDDPMYNVYLYPFNGDDITVTVTNLPSARYDLYLYGHGGPGLDILNAVFEVVAGGINYGTQATSTGPAGLHHSGRRVNSTLSFEAWLSAEMNSR